MAVSSQDVCSELLRIINTCKAALLTVADEHGLTLQQIGPLYELYSQGEMPMGALALQLHCDASNITGLTDRFEARQLNKRKQPAADRRAKLLRLTPDGL